MVHYQTSLKKKKKEYVTTQVNLNVPPNQRLGHENALFLKKKVRKSAFSRHFKEKYRNFAIEPKHYKYESRFNNRTR